MAENTSTTKTGGSELSRREFWNRGLSVAGWGALFSVGAVSMAETGRFFAPSVVFKPSSTFEVGPVEDFTTNSAVDTYGVILVEPKWKKEHRFFILRERERIYALFARCTHLGCTINWFPGLGIFKCPCHGSQFHSNGVNFAGPAPRSLDRLHISMNDTGNIVVDTSVVYSLQQFEDAKAFIKV